MVDPLSPKQISAIQRVIRIPELQPLLFNKAKGLSWFDQFYSHGFFNADKNPKPVHAKKEGFIIPYWPATEYLVNASADLAASENEEYAQKFIKLIREITEYAIEEKYSNHRTWWQLSKIIRNIPVQIIQPEDISLIDYWMDDQFERGLIVEEVGGKWLPAILANGDEHSHKIALRLLDCIYKVIFVDKKPILSEKKESILRFDSYYAGKLAKKGVAKLSGINLGLPAVEMFQKRLTSILVESDNDSWSSIWRKAIEDHPQNGSLKNADDFIVAAFRDCVIGFVEYHIQVAKDYVQSLFRNYYQTIKRVAIYAIDIRFADLKDLADSIVTLEFFHDNYRHEFWNFLNSHYPNLTSDQRKKVIETIQGLEVFGEDKKNNEKATAYKRATWLAAIKQYDDNIAEFYTKYTAIAGAEPEHPNFSSYMTVGWVDHKSPIPAEDMLPLDVDSLVKTINSYEDTGRDWFGEPGLEGLLKTFKEVLKAKAKDIYIDLMKFANSDLSFIRTIVEAYRELWNEKKDLPWNDVWPHLLDFCLQLIKQDFFWSDMSANDHSKFAANRNWIVGTIGQLIEDGTRSDDHAFDKNLLLKAKEVLVLLFERQGGRKFEIDSDAVSIAINSPRGKCLEALVILALRSCRLEHEESGHHTQAWNQYKEIFDVELKRSELGEYEFATIVAMFLPNFDYMSREWVQSHLADIFDQSDYQKWLCAMQGYTYVDLVYEIYYKHLKANGDFIKALDDANLKKRVDERIIQNIVIAFINDFEDINQPDSLIATLIHRKDMDELKKIVWFIWTLRDKNDLKLKDKVFEIWPRLLEIADPNTKDGRLLASSLCHWAVFVDKIDSIVESWLAKIAPYADENHNAHDLLENLAEISDTQPIEVQKVWLKMLESYSYDYPEEAFRRIFQNLVALGIDGERKAKEIVDAYIRHGLERPRTWLAKVLATAKLDI
jgi:hypothetical protein